MKKASFFTFGLVALAACGGTSPELVEPPAPESSPEVVVDRTALTADVARGATAAAESAQALVEVFRALAGLEGGARPSLREMQSALSSAASCAGGGLDVEALALFIRFDEGGCELGGLTLSGGVVVSLVEAEGGPALSIALEDLVIDALALSGTLVVTPRLEGGALILDTDAALTVELAPGRTLTIAGVLTRRGDAATVSIEGSGEVSGAWDAVTYSGTFDMGALERDRADCHPHAGTASLDLDAVVINEAYDPDCRFRDLLVCGWESQSFELLGTLAFLEETPSTGRVQVTVNGVTEDRFLEACPDPTRTGTSVTRPAGSPRPGL